MEDHEGNLWVGTDGDGIVRLEAKGRAYHLRDPQHNQEDGTEFTRVSQAQVGWPFERVADLSRGVEQGVWCVLKSKEGQSAVARSLDGRWQVLPWPKEFATAGAVEEIEPGTVLVGIGEEPSEFRGGLVKLDWASRRSPRSKDRNTRFVRSPRPRTAGSSPPPGGRCMRRGVGGCSDGGNLPSRAQRLNH